MSTRLGRKVVHSFMKHNPHISNLVFQVFDGVMLNEQVETNVYTFDEWKYEGFLWLELLNAASKLKYVHKLAYITQGKLRNKHMHQKSNTRSIIVSVNFMKAGIQCNCILFDQFSCLLGFLKSSVHVA